MNKGSYQLHIEISENIQIKIGSLGICNFEKGKYVYTGSAMSSLTKRVERHLKMNKKMHWHIDYLLTNRNVTITKIELFPSSIKQECQLNHDIINNHNGVPAVLGFGSSDCKNCPSHFLLVQ